MFFFFFFNDTATTEIYTLSLHDALPISDVLRLVMALPQLFGVTWEEFVLNWCLGNAPIEDRETVEGDRKSTRLNSSHGYISYAVFCLKKKKILWSRDGRLGRS